jgi:hypothetical protein
MIMVLVMLIVAISTVGLAGVFVGHGLFVGKGSCWLSVLMGGVWR